MAKIFLRRDLGGLRPSDVSSEEYLQNVSFGKILECKISQPRNIRLHQKYWAMIGLIFKNQSYFQTPDDLHNAIKIRTGYSTVYQFKDGSYWHSPSSINFKSMDEQEFNEFYEKAVGFVTVEVIPRLTSQDIQRELEGF